MTGLSPFTLTVYTRAFQRIGWIGAPLRVELVPRHLSTGYCKVTVPTDDLRVPYLMDSGARMTVHYLGELVMSGRVSAAEGDGPRREGTLTVTIDDDFRLLTRLLGWPNPAGVRSEASGVTNRRSNQVAPSAPICFSRSKVETTRMLACRLRPAS